MQEWEKQFDEIALQKGRKLYQTKRVGDFIKDDKKVSAVFAGAQVYRVEIAMENGMPVRMHCQCPKARGGSKCEHMAATLFALFGDEETERMKAKKEAELKKQLEEAEKQKKLAEQRYKKELEEQAYQKRLEEQTRQGELEEQRRKKNEERRLRKEEMKRRQEEAKRIRQEEARQKAAAIRQKEEEKKKKEEAKRKEEERKMKEQERRQAAEEKQEPEYRYFDIEKIRSGLEISRKNRMEGKNLLENGGLRDIDVETGYMEDSEDMICVVKATGAEGRNRFGLQVVFDRDEAVSSYCGCQTCRRGEYGWYYKKCSCAYVSAALDSAEQFLDENHIGDATTRTGAILMGAFSRKRENSFVEKATGAAESLGLEPRLKEKGGELALSFKIETPKKFVIRDLFEFCRQVRESLSGNYGSNTRVNHQIGNFNARAREWIAYIGRVIQEEERREEHIEKMLRYGYREARCSELELYGWRLEQFYELLGNDRVEYEETARGGKIKRILTCAEGEPKIGMRIAPFYSQGRKKFQGIDVSCSMPQFYTGVDELYYVTEKNLCRVKQNELKGIEPLIGMSDGGEMDFKIGRNKLADFYYTVLPQLGNAVELTEEEPELIQSFLPPEVIFRFYMDVRDGDIICRAHALYGEKEVSLADHLLEEKVLEGFRMKDREAEVLYRIGALFPESVPEEDEFLCGKDEEKIYQVLEHGVDELAQLGEVEYTRRFRDMNVIKKVTVSVGVSVSKGGMLDLDIDTQDISRQELLDVLKSYRAKTAYFRLKNGSFLKLEDENLRMLSEMMDTLQISSKEFLKENIHLPIYRTLYLNRLLEENEAVYNTRDSRFRQMVKSFKTVQDADFEVPESLKNVLRGYQANGYKWLRTLESYGFGGILADEMGLGKTLQTIAFLLSQKEEGRGGTSLIVAPASLVYNWKEELERFAPSLSALQITGTQEERRRLLEGWEEYDVLITSYDLLKRDIASYEDKAFLTQIIDEAQYIKTHTTAAAKAVKVIHAKHRLALTGTPVENRLSELWSIFDYLMPGFLYRYEVFKKQLETPIVKNEDSEAMERLRKMTGPFILRRLKKDVLRELPEKLEENRFVRLEGEQRKLYDAQVVKIQQRLASQSSEDFQKNRMQILAELTRLRQLCCDPSLCLEGYRDGSAKLEACMELIQSAIDGGHKILLFSQFTSMLEIIRGRLGEEKIPYYCITGATQKEKRLQMVKAFNEDDVPVFLISLKAGGVGLNLTGADVVIHYDPWWNLAVQNQATDRAHRIGQKNKVTVYKLIASHSIEEKIQKLQETKKDLAEQILNGGEGQLGSMSREELMELLEG